jgi:hypothetical protein
MTDLAVDVVLLPPAAVSRRAIAASARLRGPLRLGPRAVPHVSLAMATVAAADLPSVVAWLRDAAPRFAPLALEIPRVEGHASGRHVTAWYDIERTRDLMALHYEAVAVLEDLRSGTPHRRMLALGPGERVSASSLRWIQRFGTDAFGLRYHPHITLGYGAPAPEPALPIRFRASRLALFQLGSHCTCARRLAEVRLRGA